MVRFAEPNHDVHPAVDAAYHAKYGRQAGPFAVVADPTPAYIAIPSMLVVTIIFLILAAYRIRHMEIRYGSD